MKPYHDYMLVDCLKMSIYAQIFRAKKGYILTIGQTILPRYSYLPGIVTCVNPEQTQQHSPMVTAVGR